MTANRHPFYGHTTILQRFRDCYERGRLGSAYLFVGPPGVGKKTLALRLAQGLLCEQAPSPVDPCQQCGPCQQVRAESHPDVAVITRPRDRASIPLELLIGDREHRSGEGFCHWVALTPQSGRWKIGIIDDADYLNVEGANSLLKTLEEPPSRSVLILIATSEQRQLPTIRSRCQIIRFGGIPTADLARLLQEQADCTDPETAQRAAQAGAGSFELAQWALDSEWSALQQSIWQGLAGLPRSRWELVQQVHDYLEGAGTESSEKRRAMRMVLDWSVQYWRSLLHVSQGFDDPACAAPLRRLIDAHPLPLGRVDWAVNCLERTLDAQGQVDSNVMLPAFVEAWLDDLTQLPASF